MNRRRDETPRGLHGLRYSMNATSTATEMLACLRGQEISAVELLDLHLRRIAMHNPALNAIVALDLEGAQRTARECDDLRVLGNELPLLGLPITVKDAIDVAGLPTTSGLRRRRDVRPAADARAVARLRNAGAVIMGKTNVPPYVADWQTDNPLFGRTKNPWDLDRTPGGSTGGGAAAVASGLSPLELGSDIGGSIRLPAAFCGVYGHRPSDSALPVSGHFPGAPLPSQPAVLNVLGPLTRSAADLDLALGVMAGPDVGDDVAWRLEFPPPRHERLQEFRVAVMPGLEWLPVSDSVAAALEAVSAALQQAGARVAEAWPDVLDDSHRYHAQYETLLSSVFSFLLGQDEDARREEAARLRRAGDTLDAARADGLTASAHEFLGSLRRREEVRASYRAFFREWDILLAPITLTEAFPHDSRPEAERTIAVGGKEVPYMRQLVYPGLATLSGQPATAFPADKTASGLPVGLQAIGPYLEDRTPIRFCQLVAERLGGYVVPPGYE